MQLREYLFRRRLTVTDFARMINHNRNYINLITCKSRKPGKKLARTIEAATDGFVTAKELLNDRKEDDMELIR